MLFRSDTFDFVGTNVINNTIRKKARPIQWIGLYLCIILYILCMVVIIRLSSLDNELYIYIFGTFISRSIISGIVAQIQVILSVFMTLHPIKRGFVVAIMLNFFEATAAIRSAMFYGNMNSLPGTVIPIATIFIISIIFWYSKRLKKQINKVIQNNITIQENEEKLKHLAYYDTLTGLPNRKIDRKSTRLNSSH